jgi:adenosine deaminase
VCPGSNVALGVYPDPPAVPLPTLLAAGARVALGADDPLLFGSRLLDQYESARRDHGLDDAALADLAAASVTGSRAPDDVQKRLLADIDAWREGDGSGDGCAGSDRRRCGAVSGRQRPSRASARPRSAR